MICILGAGLAGDSAAATLRTEGYAGPITLIGDEAVPPYDRPPLSKEALFDHLPEDRLFLRAESWYEEQGIDLVLGVKASAIDAAAQKVSLADGREFSYSKLLIATGARARSLPGARGAAVPAFVVRTLQDAHGLRELLTPGARVAVVGAGVIGLEVAASASKLGCSVDVVELADRVMSRVVPPALSAHIAELHRAHGIRLHLSAGSVSLSVTGLDTGVFGAIAADVVVIGIGVVPNTELAVAAGLECRDGVVVDEFARTSDAAIYAAGDVARYPSPFGEGMIRCENWKHAQNHAALAARNMLGGTDAYRAASSMWSDQFDMKLQTVGMLADSGEIMRGEFGASKFMLFYRDAAGLVVGALGINQPKDMRFAQILIEKRVAVDAERLADPKQDLRKMAA